MSVQISRGLRRGNIKSVYLVYEDSVNSLNVNKYQELNFIEDGNSFLSLKAEVYLPSM